MQILQLLYNTDPRADNSDKNYLGLDFNTKGNKPKFRSSNYNDRIKSIRECYEQILEIYNNNIEIIRNDTDLRNKFEELLSSFHNGWIEHDLDELAYLAENYNTDSFHPVAVAEHVANIKRTLETLDHKEYSVLINTLSSANSDGFVFYKINRIKKFFKSNTLEINAHLADIINTFTYLYGRDNNPILMDKSSHQTAADFLSGLANYDASGNRWQRAHAKAFLDHIAKHILHLKGKTKEELGMTFAYDDVQHEAIVRKLKILFNRIALQYEYSWRFENSLDQYGNKTYDYQLVPHFHTEAVDHASIETKIWTHNWKKRIWFIAIIPALIISLGQVALAILGTAAALAIVIGIASCFTNFFLFQGDIRTAFMNMFVKGGMFAKLPKALRTLLYLFAGASIASGIISGGLVFTTLLVPLGITTLATAPIASLIFVIAVTASTFIGMSCLLLNSGHTLIKKLQGKTLRDVFKNAWHSLVNFFKVPKCDQATENSKAMKFAHTARHVLKCFFAVVFVPAAIVASFIATVSLSIMSQAGTKTLFQSLHFGVKVSDKLAYFLTWYPALFVQGTLNTKNLIEVGVAFAQMFSKLIVASAASVVTFGHLLLTGRLLSSIKAGWKAFKENPYRTAVPGIYYGILIFFGVAIALNGYGNGQGRAFKAPWISYLTTLIATALASVGINLMAVLGSFRNVTPILELDKPEIASVSSANAEAENTVAVPLNQANVSNNDVEDAIMSKDPSTVSPTPSKLSSSANMHPSATAVNNMARISTAGSPVEEDKSAHLLEKYIKREGVKPGIFNKAGSPVRLRNLRSYQQQFGLGSRISTKLPSSCKTAARHDSAYVPPPFSEYEAPDMRHIPAAVPVW